MSLTDIENAVLAAYTSADATERTAATQMLASFFEPDSWGDNINILNSSASVYALHFAATNLKTTITKFFNSFSAEEKTQIRQTLLDCLSRSEAHSAQLSVLSAVSTCFARIQKICWFEENPSDVVLQDIYPFLQNSVDYQIIGLDIMTQLVEEISSPTSSLSPGQQRKVAVSFRDKCLKDIFTSVLQMLTNVDQNGVPNPGTKEFVFLEALINLSVTVLSFDFIGTAIDSSFDHLGVIHIPSSWAQLIQEPGTLGVFFSLYGKTQTPLSTKILECIGLLSAVRYTVLPANARLEHLNNLISAFGNIISQNIGLEDDENIHQFSRLLVRFKANYQLKILISATNFQEFLQLMAQFSLAAFATDNLNTNFYLITFWSRIISAFSNYDVKVKRGGEGLAGSEFIGDLAPDLLRAFLSAQLQQVYLQSYEDNFDSDELISIIEILPTIGRCRYAASAKYLYDTLSEITTQYQNYLQPNAPQYDDHLVAYERQLTWVVLVIASIVGARKPSLSIVEEDETDGHLISAIFRLLEMTDQRFVNKGASPVTHHLEFSFGYFLKQFCKAFLTDDVINNTSIYQLILTTLNLQQANDVVEVVIRKIMKLLESWSDEANINSLILGPSGLFFSLAAGFSTSKKIGKSEMVTQILHHHNNIPLGSSRDKVSFYKTLGRLFFADKTNIDFYEFMAPFDTNFQSIKDAVRNGIPENQVMGFREAFNTILDDLRGLISSIYNPAGYRKVFTWFYTETENYEWLLKFVCSSGNLLSEEEFWAAMKFILEFINNRHSRILFSPSSADGLRLFKTSASFFVSNRDTILSGSADSDSHYTSLKLYLRGCYFLLLGNYANFGVFELYNDNTLTELLQAIYTIILSLTPDDFVMYPKTQKYIYFLVNVTSKDHISFVIENPQIFKGILNIIKAGFQTKSKVVIKDSADSLESFLSYHFSNLVAAKQNRLTEKRTMELQVISDLMAENKPMLDGFFIDFFDLLLTFDNSHWSIGKVFLVLSFIFPESANTVQQVVINSQSNFPEKVEKLKELFTNLTKNLSDDLHQENVDAFTANLAALRKEMSVIIDINALYKAFFQLTN